MSDENQRLRAARSYDGAASTYERINAPLLFDAPARALVDAVAPSPDGRILDVGCGTGAVSRAARAVNARAMIVALDPSLDMLQAASRGGIAALVNGSLPHLPFAAGSFDAVLCAFVLTHVDDPDSAIRDMKRVLRAGGSIGASAWAAGDDEYTATWSDVVSRYVEPERMARAADVILPAEPRFSKPDGLSNALRACGFDAVQSHDIDLQFHLTVDEHIEAREVCAAGRALQSLLSTEDWERFRGDVRAALSERFPNGVAYTRRVFIASGRQPIP